jgi:hypothetical protein
VPGVADTGGKDRLREDTKEKESTAIRMVAAFAASFGLDGLGVH